MVDGEGEVRGEPEGVVWVDEEGVKLKLDGAERSEEEVLIEEEGVMRVVEVVLSK
jgi:hypothetical protein